MYLGRKEGAILSYLIINWWEIELIWMDSQVAMMAAIPHVSYGKYLTNI